MRDGRPSLTAAFVAAARQMGRLLPEDVRVADDPYGAAFTSPRFAELLEHDGARALVRLRGVRAWIAYMQVRTKVIDDAVRDFVRAGGEQIVVLGAGYDCRALRMPELEGARVFEVDHPSTQRRKRSVLDRLHAQSKARYVVWDFEARPMRELPAALATAGHDAAAPTLTIWEGVTMYLTEEAIDASLRTIRAYGAPGSELVMTHFAKGSGETSALKRAAGAVVALVGEPWRFGWEPSKLAGYLEARGFELLRDVTTPDAARALLPADLAELVTDGDRRIALARVR